MYDPVAQAEADEALIQEWMAKDTTIKNPVRTPNGVYYIKRQAGSGQQVAAGNSVKVHYIGRFLNGSVFESSYDSNSPFVFKVGSRQVIKGWDEGLPYMQKGETARLYIPSGLAYGPAGSRSIPPSTVLVFDINVLEVYP